jgi:hypothetical protein
MPSVKGKSMDTIILGAVVIIIIFGILLAADLFGGLL